MMWLMCLRSSWNGTFEILMDFIISKVEKMCENKTNPARVSEEAKVTWLSRQSSMTCLKWRKWQHFVVKYLSSKQIKYIFLVYLLVDLKWKQWDDT